MLQFYKKVSEEECTLLDDSSSIEVDLVMVNSIVDTDFLIPPAVVVDTNVLIMPLESTVFTFSNETSTSNIIDLKFDPKYPKRFFDDIYETFLTCLDNPGKVFIFDHCLFRKVLLLLDYTGKSFSSPEFFKTSTWYEILQSTSESEIKIRSWHDERFDIEYYNFKESYVEFLQKFGCEVNHIDYNKYLESKNRYFKYSDKKKK